MKLDERFCCLFSICVSPAAENRRRANIVVYIIVNGLVSEKGGHFGAQTAHQKVKQKSNIFSYKRNFQRNKKRAKGRIIPLRKQKTRTESLIRTWTPKQTRTRTRTVHVIFAYDYELRQRASYIIKHIKKGVNSGLIFQGSPPAVHHGTNTHTTTTTTNATTNEKVLNKFQ